ncbi:serine/threonine-protein kinase [Streptomyces apocyni]|uniref:serine/threonine-protein kinase n=1 Tax=Streptomyces apocyni TaxID=2654677 RepID=UPI0012EA2BA7|nr:serine/threonine-protein kinase [Streptomyces apocyni]
MEKLSPGDPSAIGPYRLLGRLGAGGMGQVYLARSERGRTVALKVVQTELAEREEFRARFRQEVAAARRVGGAWTAPVLDADTEAAVPWVATGYVAGPSLHRVVAHDHGPLPESSVRTLAAGLVRALQDIHAAGLIHRDLKPSNIMITIDGPRVIDFGIARALETSTADGLTHTGALVGSPSFMAPEQIRGDRITPACDVFCLGSVLAFAGTGVLPFGAEASGVHAQLFRIAQEDPDLSRLSEGLQDLVLPCLAKDPADRPSLAELLERTGAEKAVGEGRTREPWLPGALVAQLGRHAVRLLEVEHPEHPEHSEHKGDREGESGAVGEAGAGPGAGAGAEGTAEAPPVPPTLIAPPPPPAAPQAPPAAYPYQPTLSYGQPLPPRRNGRTTALLLAVAVVVALGAGGTVYAVMKGDGIKPQGQQQGQQGKDQAQNQGQDQPSTAPPASSDQPSGPSATPDASPPTTISGEDDEEEGDIPARFLGVWRSSFQAQGGTNTRVMTIVQGATGDTVMNLVGTGPNYDCRWQASLRSAGTTSLEFSPSRVVRGSPQTCKPGPVSQLRMPGNGTLVRELVGSGGVPLTYTR